MKWKEYLTVGYRLILLTCSFAVLYLQNHFVSKETYESDRKAIIATQVSMSEVLATMIERNKVNDRQDELLKDHENRIRVLELRR